MCSVGPAQPGYEQLWTFAHLLCTHIPRWCSLLRDWEASEAGETGPGQNSTLSRNRRCIFPTYTVMARARSAPAVGPHHLPPLSSGLTDTCHGAAMLASFAMLWALQTPPCRLSSQPTKSGRSSSRRLLLVRVTNLPLSADLLIPGTPPQDLFVFLDIIDINSIFQRRNA